MENTVEITKSTKNAENQEKIQKRVDERLRLGLPWYSLGEEIFSAVAHGVSAMFAVAALVILLIFCNKSPITIVSVSIFGGSMILLYTFSTLYHALGISKAKKVFQILDHCAIFLLIAGTYTPITLVSLGGTQGWIMFSVVWAAAIVGIILNSVDLKRFSRVCMVCYLTMGWILVFAMDSFIKNAGLNVLILIGIGGAFYTIGAVLYMFGKKIKYMHSVWHIFVFGGSLFHFFAVYQMVTL